VSKQTTPKLTSSTPRIQPKADKDDRKIESKGTSDASVKVHTETVPQSLKSESKSSLATQSSSSPIVSESEDEISSIMSEESPLTSISKRQGDPTVPAHTTVRPVTEKSKNDKTSASRALQSKKIVKVASSKPKKVTSTPLKNSLPPLTAKLSAIAKQPANDRPAHKDDKDTNSASQTLDSSSDLVDVTDSEMSIMSGLNLNAVGDIPRQSTGIELTSEKISTTEHTPAEGESDKAGKPGEGGEGGEYDNSGSVTVTELSGEEEIEEDIDDSGEDTMFEETLTQSGIN
jgi:hypothetical protein